jgi:hypothetical protein
LSVRLKLTLSYAGFLIAEKRGVTIETSGEKLTPQLVATVAEPFQRGSNAHAPTTQASG